MLVKKSLIIVMILILISEYAADSQPMWWPEPTPRALTLVLVLTLVRPDPGPGPVGL